MRFATVLLAFAVSASALAQQPSSSSAKFQLAQTYTLGGDGGWDYIVPDSAHHRLFIARQSRVMVVDEDGKLLHEIAGVNGAHGTAIDPASNLGFATSSGDKAIVVFNASTYAVVKKVPAAEDADAIIFDEPTHRIFSLNGDAENSTVLDGRTGDLITNIPLGGKPEYAASAGDGKLYVNLVDKSEIVEVDTKALKVTRHWSTAPCTTPVSLAIDTAHHRLFSGCRSGVMAVSDYVAGKVIATAPIGKGVDGGAFDPRTGSIFESAGDGTLTVIHQDSPDKYTVSQTLTTPPGARTMAFDPATRRAFTVTAQFGPVPAGQRRGPVLPGTFKLLVFEPATK